MVMTAKERSPDLREPRSRPCNKEGKLCRRALGEVAIVNHHGRDCNPVWNQPTGEVVTQVTIVEDPVVDCGDQISMKS